MGVLKISTVFLAVSFLWACSAPPPPSTPAPRVKTFADPLLQQLDKAHDVQNTVNQNTDNTRKAVDEQERGDSSQ